MPIRTHCFTRKGMDTARKTVLILLLFMLFPTLGHAWTEQTATLPGRTLVWDSPEQGIDTALLSYTVKKSDGYTRLIHVHILKIDSTLFDFQLFSSRWEGVRAKSMREWAEEKGLAAAINACMYQTDGLTSTGYMRSGEKLNNRHIAKKYGSFFVSGPCCPGLPQASVLDRQSDDWQALLPLYKNVVQNFRLMGQNGEQLWPENGPRHAVAAVAEDHEGRILFLLCSEPVSVYDFVEALNAFPDLALKSAMYVEGGSDAALLMKKNGKPLLVNGLSPAGYMLSNRGDEIPLPNIIGVKRR